MAFSWCPDTISKSYAAWCAADKPPRWGYLDIFLLTQQDTSQKRSFRLIVPWFEHTLSTLGISSESSFAPYVLSLFLDQPPLTYP